MTIESEVQNLSPSALITLYELDATAQGAGVFRFYPGFSKTLAPVVWQGVSYDPFPIEIGNVSRDANGVEPRPSIRVSNIARAMTAFLRDYDDLLGALVVRKQTFARFLDAVNFPEGNPDANPAVALPDQLYVIERKVSESREMVEFELKSQLDIENRTLPARQIVKNVCPWRYRSPECSYSGLPVAKVDDTPTTVAADDVCGKRLSSCKLRFGENGELPTGAFPASNLIARV